jgi:hypothetical protein
MLIHDEAFWQTLWQAANINENSQLCNLLFDILANFRKNLQYKYTNFKPFQFISIVSKRILQNMWKNVLNLLCNPCTTKHLSLLLAVHLHKHFASSVYMFLFPNFCQIV